jgi:hypothetical protein
LLPRPEGLKRSQLAWRFALLTAIGMNATFVKTIYHSPPAGSEDVPGIVIGFLAWNLLPATLFGIASVLRKQERKPIDDADFGRITFGRIRRGKPAWEGNTLQLWGGSIQIVVSAGPEGPSEDQRSFFRSLRTDNEIRARIEEAVATHAKQTAATVGPLKISSLYLPVSPLQQRWRVWFDMVGEEHYWYGAEVDGQRIIPFTMD